MIRALSFCGAPVEVWPASLECDDVLVQFRVGPRPAYIAICGAAVRDDEILKAVAGFRQRMAVTV